MGHSLVSGRQYSFVLDLRSNEEQNKDMHSKYGLIHGIEEHIRGLKMLGLVENYPLHHVFKGGKSRF